MKTTITEATYEYDRRTGELVKKTIKETVNEDDSAVATIDSEEETEETLEFSPMTMKVKFNVEDSDEDDWDDDDEDEEDWDPNDFSDLLEDWPGDEVYEDPDGSDELGEDEAADSIQPLLDAMTKCIETLSKQPNRPKREKK